MKFCALERVDHEHGNGHRPYTPRDWGNVRSDRKSGREINVSNQALTILLGRIWGKALNSRDWYIGDALTSDIISSNIDNDCPGLKPISLDPLWLAYRRNDDICGFDLWEHIEDQQVTGKSE